MRKILIALLIFVAIIVTPALAQDNESTGTVAYIGDDGNVYLYDIALDQSTAVTTDASATPSKFYQWPTWSTDGQLAFFGVSEVPDNPYFLGVFIQANRDAPPKGVYASEDEAFTYAHWAPGNCSDGDRCRDLALLYTSADGLNTRIIRASNTFEVTEISQGAPHYWDWSPDGQQMFWSRFGQQFEIYDAESGGLTFIDQSPGAALSIDWSPQGEEVLVAIGNDRFETELSILDSTTGNVIKTIASGFSAGVAYGWSYDANHIAYVDLENGDLVVYDVAAESPISIVATQVIAFFWSPADNQLAYISLDSGGNGPNIKAQQADQMAQDDLGLAWGVYDVDTDTNRTLGNFFPSNEMVYYLRFFDQFIHSHSLWSPDGQYIVYSEFRDNGTPFVTLLDVQNATTRQFAEGTIGVFSWR